MKKTILVLAAAMALAIGANAQMKTPPAKSKPSVQKTMPMRDPKTGRFMKKSPTMHEKGKSTKTMPMRDPKTGRFMKKPMSPMDKMHEKGTSKKAMPMRDPKTGKFMKKKG